MKTKLLHEVARIYNGNSINERVKAQNFMNLKAGTPYIATKDISFFNKVNYENGVKIPNESVQNFKLAKKGSVLLCAEGGSAGRKMAIIERDVFFVNKLFCFETNPDLDSKFLFYYIQSPEFQGLFKNSLSGLIGGVSLQKVRNLPINLPSMEIQQSMVERLDNVFAEIALIEKNIQLKEEKTNQLWQSVLNHAFAENQKFEMKKVKLGEICEIITRGISPKYDDESNIRVLNQRCIRANKVDVNFARGHDESLKSVSSEKTLKPGDGLINSTGVGTLGRTAIFSLDDGKKYTVDSHVTICRPKKDIIRSDYFGFILRNLEKNFVDLATGTSGQTELSRYSVKGLEIIIHSQLSFQKRIASQLSNLLAEIERLESQITTEKQKVAELRQSILSDAFNFADEAA